MAETAEMIDQAGGTAVAHSCDVGDESAVARATSLAVNRFGGVDILVANAGISTMGAVHELTLADWDLVMRVNLTGVFLSIRAALGHMLEGGGGSIITIGSVSSVVVGAGRSAASYKAAKGGVLQLTRAVAVEYAGEGIRANCVCPGNISTDMRQHAKELAATKTTTRSTWRPRPMSLDVPVDRAADPAEVASVIAFLASDDASFMTGSAVMVDGGYTAI